VIDSEPDRKTDAIMTTTAVCRLHNVSTNHVQSRLVTLIDVHSLQNDKPFEIKSLAPEVTRIRVLAKSPFFDSIPFWLNSPHSVRIGDRIRLDV